LSVSRAAANSNGRAPSSALSLPPALRRVWPLLDCDLRTDLRARPTSAMCSRSTARERRLTSYTNRWSRGRDTLTVVCNDCMVRPGPDPDSYPPIDPDDPVPDDPGELSDTSATLPPAPVEPMPGPDDPDSVPAWTELSAAWSAWPRQRQSRAAPWQRNHVRVGGL